MKRAVCLVSGGMDSAVASAIARGEGYELYFVFVDYGQKTNRKELNCARELSEHFGAKEFKILKLDWLREIGGSALTDDRIAVPKVQDPEDRVVVRCTYVPFRNTILWSLATAYAEIKGAEAIYSGSNPDCPHPDNTAPYVAAMQTVVYLGTRPETRIDLRAPIKNMLKDEIVALGSRLSVPFELTWSCYVNNEIACGTCESCLRRYRGFVANGMKDPIPYDRKPDLQLSELIPSNA